MQVIVKHYFHRRKERYGQIHLKRRRRKRRRRKEEEKEEDDDKKWWYVYIL